MEIWLQRGFRDPGFPGLRVLLYSPKILDMRFHLARTGGPEFNVCLPLSTSSRTCLGGAQFSIIRPDTEAAPRPWCWAKPVQCSDFTCLSRCVCLPGQRFDQIRGTQRLLQRISSDE